MCIFPPIKQKCKQKNSLNQQGTRVMPNEKGDENRKTIKHHVLQIFCKTQFIQVSSMFFPLTSKNFKKMVIFIFFVSGHNLQEILDYVDTFI